MLERTVTHPIKGNISSRELDESEALLILSAIPSLGPVKIRSLLRHFGNARAAIHADPGVVASLPGFSEKIVNALTNWPIDDTWKRNLLHVIKDKVHLIPWSSSHYPKRLLEISDAPVLLYMKGTLLPADQRSIAVVGTRQASIYGLEMAKHFSRDLAALGFTVVSGLARGVDTAAHVGALERGRTIGVIGSGLGEIYPTENRLLADQMAGHGAIISEFPMATPPDRQNFPQRNRIVCGMTQATLLIEAPVKSGAMITMRQGEEQGRRLFAIPGRLDNDNFRGNHSLIKQGKALLVESANEIASYFDDLFGSVSLNVSHERAPSRPLDAEESALLRMLPNQELSIEQIFEITKIPISALNVLLMKLVMKSHIKEFPGKVYKKTGVAR